MRPLDTNLNQALWDIISNLWDPNSNPNGSVSLNLAENTLMHNELRDYINTQHLIDPPASNLTYGSGLNGSKPIRASIAKFLTRHFKPPKPLNSDHILVTNGVSSALEHCAWALANPGDGILLGRPYYRAFLADISLRTGVNVVPVSCGTADPFSVDCVPLYEKALLDSTAQGIPIRALLLCNPHNPLGRCYPLSTLTSLLLLCAKHKIHLVSDEIYALSVWENRIDAANPAPRVPFQSILSVPSLSSLIDPSLVHVLWGVSKDFGANGLRLGALISPANPGLLQAARACGVWSSPSSLAESAVCKILNDRAFVESYVRLNRKRLAEAYVHVVGELEKWGIEYLPGANAGFFVWVDLGKLYRANDDDGGSREGTVGEGEGITAKIQARLLESKVYLVDGDAAGAEEPGWFRLVFTQPPGLVSEAVRRTATALKS